LLFIVVLFVFRSGCAAFADDRGPLGIPLHRRNRNGLHLRLSVPPWGTQKSYLIPALEIVGFDVLLNLFDRAYFGCCDFDVDFSSIKCNCTEVGTSTVTTSP
jgi:hypothetical protein